MTTASSARAGHILNFSLAAATFLGLCMLAAYMFAGIDPGGFVLATVPGWLALAGYGGVCAYAVWKSRLAGRTRWQALAADGVLVALGGGILLGIYATVLVQSADPGFTAAHRDSLVQPILSSGASAEVQAEGLQRVYAAYPLLFQPVDGALMVAMWATLMGSIAGLLAAGLFSSARPK